MNKLKLVFFFCVVMLVACTAGGPIYKLSNETVVSVSASIETTAVSSWGDAADDPAIWVNSDDPSQSLIYGTDKKAGLLAFDLNGNLVQTILAGRLNNVDLREFKSGAFSAVVAASNRSTDSVSLFLAGSDGRLTWLEASEIGTGLDDPYGLCMFDDGGQLSVFVNDTDGRYQQWLLRLPGELASTNVEQASKISVGASLVREWKVAAKPEGCAVDDTSKTLFLGVESTGVYSMSAVHTEPVEMATVIAVDGETIVADVEGMDVYRSQEDTFLVISSQGNHSFAVVDLEPPHTYRGSFTIDSARDATNDTGIGPDGAEETDGIALTSVSLSSAFPDGLMVAQDGYNTLPQEKQNFKLLSWRLISNRLGLD